MQEDTEVLHEAVKRGTYTIDYLRKDESEFLNDVGSWCFFHRAGRHRDGAWEGHTRNEDHRTYKRTSLNVHLQSYLYLAGTMRDRTVTG